VEDFNNADQIIGAKRKKIVTAFKREALSVLGLTEHPNASLFCGFAMERSSSKFEDLWEVMQTLARLMQSADRDTIVKGRDWDVFDAGKE